MFTIDSARSAYAERKAELVGTSNKAYDLDSTIHPGQMVNHISPGSVRRSILENQDGSPTSGNSTSFLINAYPSYSQLNMSLAKQTDTQSGLVS